MSKREKSFSAGVLGAGLAFLCVAFCLAATPAVAEGKKPNMVMIMTDDVG